MIVLLLCIDWSADPTVEVSSEDDVKKAAELLIKCAEVGKAK